MPSNGGYPTNRDGESNETAQGRGIQTEQGGFQIPSTGIPGLGGSIGIGVPIPERPPVPRVGHGVPSVSRDRSGAQARALAGLAGRAARAIARRHILNMAAEYALSAGSGSGWPGPATIPPGSGWVLCNAYSACGTKPEKAKHEGAPSSCPTTIGADCLTMQAHATLHSLGQGVVDNTIRALIWTTAPPPDLARVTHVRMWTRPKFVVHPSNAVPYYDVGVGTTIRTDDTVLWPDPFLQPIAQPIGTPATIPFDVIPARVPNPWRDPGEQTVTGPEPLRRFRPIVDPWVHTPTVIDIDMVPRVRTWPDYEPRTRTQPDVGTAPVHPGPPPPPHTATPDDADNRSRKLILAARGGIYITLNIVTEGLDVLYAFHNALPMEYRAPRGITGPPSPQDAAYALWMNLDHLDLGQAIQNLIVNAAEDTLLGYLGRLQGRANRNLSEGTGVRIQVGLGPAM